MTEEILTAEFVVDEYQCDFSTETEFNCEFAVEAESQFVFNDGAEFVCEFDTGAEFECEFGNGTVSGDYEGSYTVTPTEQTQTLPTANKTLSQNVTVNPIPSNYGKITWDGRVLTVS